jgi:hypothetical protein
VKWIKRAGCYPALDWLNEAVENRGLTSTFASEHGQLPANPIIHHPVWAKNTQILFKQFQQPWHAFSILLFSWLEVSVTYA